ncbi:MAG: GTP-binding protein [Oscillospiraceae bacterium]|nr:GTP-binding protein [Oscillospiraceae bacterium]
MCASFSAMFESKPEPYKVCLLGCAGVGKTCFAIRVIKGEFREDPQATIGVGFADIKMEVDGKVVQFKLWDTAGQERYRCLVPSYAKGSNAVILMHNLADPNSADGLTEYLSMIPNDCNIVAVVGNKLDLKSGDDVNENKFNFPYFEISAMTGMGVQEVISWVAQKLVELPLCTETTHEELPRPGEKETCAC